MYVAEENKSVLVQDTISKDSLRWEVRIRESNNFPQVLLINFAQNIQHGDGLG
jgi:hypothetical protein